ncbi:MAG: cysteine desulfurase [Synergistaceae bacterium]|jgi:cysteine desulfurase|nr:cysteine desulfurase [Synergistaceae bacterium]
MKQEKTMIYADNAATTRLDMDVLDAMLPFLCEEYGNPSNAYSFARTGKKALKEAREKIASCIGALPEEIFFTSGGTESDNWAIKGAIFASQSEKKHLITSRIEHHAVLHSCYFLKEAVGVDVTYLQTDREGFVSANVLEEAIRDCTVLASVMLANNEIGTIEKIQKLAEKAHTHGVLFHTDAVQAVGHIPVNVAELGVDMLSASAHKFNGPKGIGFLYKRKGVALFSYMSGGAQESGQRAGTENVAYIVGMAAALEKKVGCLEESMAHNSALAKNLLRLLHEKGIDFLLNGHSEKRLPGNVNISIRSADGEILLHRLDLMKIYVSTGSACNAGSTDISHVIRAIGVPSGYAAGTIRITLGNDNTLEETAQIAEAIRWVTGAV